MLHACPNQDELLAQSLARTAPVVVGCGGVDVGAIKGHADARTPDGTFLRSAAHLLMAT